MNRVSVGFALEAMLAAQSDLLLEYLVAARATPPDFTRASNAARVMDPSAIEAGYARVLDMPWIDTSSFGIEDARAELANLVTRVEGYWSERSQKVSTLDIGPYRILIAGGLSNGDVLPTSEAQDILRFRAYGFDRVAGFIEDEPSTTGE
jgi:hypothetical protein